MVFIKHLVPAILNQGHHLDGLVVPMKWTKSLAIANHSVMDGRVVVDWFDDNKPEKTWYLSIKSIQIASTGALVWSSCTSILSVVASWTWEKSMRSINPETLATRWTRPSGLHLPCRPSNWSGNPWRIPMGRTVSLPTFSGWSLW